MGNHSPPSAGCCAGLRARTLNSDPLQAFFGLHQPCGGVGITASDVGKPPGKHGATVTAATWFSACQFIRFSTSPLRNPQVVNQSRTNQWEEDEHQVSLQGPDPHLMIYHGE